MSRLLKGESSHWINQTDAVTGKFYWQTGYAAFSVGYEGIDAVKTYISNQDDHHRRESFVEEFEATLRKVGYSQEEVAMLLEIKNP